MGIPRSILGESFNLPYNHFCRIYADCEKRPKSEGILRTPPDFLAFPNNCVTPVPFTGEVYGKIHY